MATITFKFADDEGFIIQNSVKVSFNSEGMDAQEVFRKWVGFMNAVGYSFDPVEMEDLWNGALSEKEQERRSALEHGMFS